ncbi:MAG: response regulator [Cyanobacteria bacterium SBLK]|nr:response regulator [Cyanobacteria bacterium SBLK]
MQRFASSIARLSRRLFLKRSFSPNGFLSKSVHRLLFVLGVGTKPQPEYRDRRWWQIFYTRIAILVSIYSIGFPFLFSFLHRASIVAHLPLKLYVAWEFGGITGAFVALILMPIDVLAVYWVGGTEHLHLISTPFWTGQVGGMLFAYTLGQAGQLQKRLRRELEKTKALQQKLQQEKENAEIANRAKDTLLMSISHDLRTPMSAIAQTAELLRFDLERDRRLSLIDNIETSTHQLLQTVNDLLALYRSNTNTVAEVAEPFHLRQAIADISRLMQPLFTEKGLTLNDRIAADIPDELSGSPKLLRQILFNLLGNSLKYTDRGGVEIAVTLQKQQEETVDLLFSLQDTGRGIPSEQIPRILDESYRFSRLDGEKEGYGLGLGNCQRMVAKMGGTLRLESVEGQGTTLFLALSFRKTHETEIFAPERSRVDFVSPSPPKDKIRVLLVEDDAVNLATVVEMLQILNCEVEATTNGIEALTKSSKEIFALAIIDMQLPDMTGIEIVRDLHARMGKAPYTVLLTANILLASLQESLHSPIDLILTKPIRFQELQRILHRVVSSEEGQSPLSVPGLDRNFLNQEIDLLGEEIIRQLWETFLAKSLPALDECLLAYATEEYQKCARHAHRLSSGAANMGLVALAKVAKKVEKVSDCRDRLQLYTLLKDLVQECDLGKEELEQFLGDRRA